MTVPGRGGIITGWGIAVPDKVVTNEDLSATPRYQRRLDRRAHRDSRASHRGDHLRAGHRGRTRPLEEGRAAPDEIDSVILATTTPDGIVPGTSATVQDGIGIPGGAFDVNAACSGFVYGLAVAHGMLAIGAERLLLIGSETLSASPIGTTAPSPCWSATERGRSCSKRPMVPVELLSWNLNADGSLRHLLKCDHGGYLYMDGKEIFRKAVRAVVESSERAIAEAGLTIDDIDLVVPHQANLRIISAVCQRLGIPEERR